jgi:hypothetical protein
MSKAILEFNLPEENNEFNLANRGLEYYCAIWNALQKVREIIKYREISEETENALEEVREILLEANIDDIE